MWIVNMKLQQLVLQKLSFKQQLTKLSNSNKPCSFTALIASADSYVCAPSTNSKITSQADMFFTQWLGITAFACLLNEKDGRDSPLLLIIFSWLERRIHSMLLNPVAEQNHGDVWQVEYA